MPITITKQLILVEAKPTQFVSKRTGDIVKKWRYKFLEEDKTSPSGFKFIIGWDDLGVYSEKVQTVSGWDAAKSIPIIWSVSEFAGETKLKLYIQGLEKDAGK